MHAPACEQRRASQGRWREPSRFRTLAPPARKFMGTFHVPVLSFQTSRNALFKECMAPTLLVLCADRCWQPR